MRDKNTKALVFLLCAAGIFYVLRNVGEKVAGKVGGKVETKINDQSSTYSRPADGSVNALLTDEELVYTRHARCRMDCRYIDKSEVKDILYNGKVNWRKTKEKDQPCPSYALEGKTKDGQTVRIVFADCKNATKVVTVIDLKNDYNCVCD